MDLLVEREAAALLRIHARTLKRWRLEGGLPYVVLAPVGRRRPAIRYDREALRAWVAARSHGEALTAAGPEPERVKVVRRRGRPRRTVPPLGGAGGR